MSSNPSPPRGVPFALAVPPELVEAIARRTAEMLAEHNGSATPSPWLDVDQAAAYIAARPQRVYDLVHAGTLQPARDGRRLLFRREWLDELLLEDRVAS